MQREKPLEPKKVASVFKDRIEKHKEEVEEIEALEKERVLNLVDIKFALEYSFLRTRSSLICIFIQRIENFFLRIVEML